MRVAASKLITFISTFKELTTPFVEINKWLSGQPCDQRYLNFGLLSVVAVFFYVFFVFFRVKMISRSRIVVIKVSPIEENKLLVSLNAKKASI